MKKITFYFLTLVSTVAFAQTPATAAPAAPDFGAGNFVSYFSGNNDITTNVNAYAGASIADTDIQGNTTKELNVPTPGGGFQFVTSPTDLSEMTHIYFNFYVGSVDAGEIFNINIQGGGANYNKGFDPGALGTGTWVTVDIPLTDFALSNTSRAGITNLQFTGAGGDGFGPIFFDNIIFYKPASNDQTDANLSDLKVDGTTIEGFMPNIFDYTFDVPAGSSQVPTVTATATQAGNGSSNVAVNPAGSIPGTTSITVTAPDGNATQQYTVEFVEVAIPSTGPPPTPSFTQMSDYLPIFSNTAQANVASNTNGFANGTVKDVTVGGNVVKQLKVPNPGAGFQFVTSPQDLTDFTHIYFHMWVPSVDAGEIVNVNIQGAGANYNKGYDPGALGTGTWIVVNEMLSAFAGSEVSRAGITNIQFTGAGGTDGFGPVYIDNLIFYKSGTLSNDDVSAFESTVLNNPTDTKWTVRTPNATIKSVQLFNLLGKQVFTKSLSDKEVDIPAQNLTTGIYIAKIETELGIKTIKLLRR